MIQIIWSIFGLIFITLTFFHLYQSTVDIEKFPRVGKVRKISGISIGVVEFQDKFNEYLDKVNKKNKKMHILTAVGYFVAFLTSMFSIYLSMVS